eukprot:6485598-Amphidinium_carterae.1
MHCATNKLCDARENYRFPLKSSAALSAGSRRPLKSNTCFTIRCALSASRIAFGAIRTGARVCYQQKLAIHSY